MLQDLIPHVWVEYNMLMHYIRILTPYVDVDSLNILYLNMCIPYLFLIQQGISILEHVNRRLQKKVYLINFWKGSKVVNIRICI